MKIFFKTFLLFFSLSGIALGNVIVKDLKGPVTVLVPGQPVPLAILTNDKISPNSTVVTENDSMALLKLKTGSHLTIGPNSKVIITNGNSTLVANILTGVVRYSPVKKGLKEKNLNIKTETAFLSLKGGEFISIYNPISGLTAVICLDGSVGIQKSAPNTNEEKDSLSNSETIVPIGRYSHVHSNFLNPSLPVKIATKQFLALKENKHFDKKYRIKNPYSIEEIQKIGKEINHVKIKGPKPRGEFREKTGSFAAKAGGFVDLKTGIYVQPPIGTKFNIKLNIYNTTNSIGKADPAGSYGPPPGFILTPNHGFQRDKNLKVKGEGFDIDGLNIHVGTNLPINSPEILKESALKQIEGTPFFHTHYFSAFTGISFTNVQISNSTRSGRYDTLEHTGKIGANVRLLYQYSWDNVWDTIITASFSSHTFSSENSSEPLSMPNGQLIDGAGLMTFRLFPHSVLRFGLILSELYWPYVEDGENGSLQHDLANRLDVGALLGLGIKLVNRWRFDLNISADVIHYVGKNDDGTTSLLYVQSGEAIQVGARGDLRLFDSDVYASFYVNWYKSIREFRRLVSDSSELIETSDFLKVDTGFALSFDI